MDITNDTRYFLKRVLPETSRIPCPLLRYLYAADVDEWRLFSPLCLFSRRGKEETRSSSGTGIVSIGWTCIGTEFSTTTTSRRCNRGRPLIIFASRVKDLDRGVERDVRGIALSAVPFPCPTPTRHPLFPPRHGRLGIHPLSSRRNRWKRNLTTEWIYPGNAVQSFGRREGEGAQSFPLMPPGSLF